MVTVGLLIVAIAASALLGLGPPLVMKSIVDDAILADRSRGELDVLILFMIAFVLAGAMVGVAQTYLGTAVGQGVMFDSIRP